MCGFHLMHMSLNVFAHLGFIVKVRFIFFSSMNRTLNSTKNILRIKAEFRPLVL